MSWGSDQQLMMTLLAVPTMCQMLPHWDSCQTNSDAASLASNAAQGSHMPAVPHVLYKLRHSNSQRGRQQSLTQL